MQCPKCNHIPLAGNQPDPNRCPACGIEYAAAIRERVQQSQHTRQAAEQQMSASPAPHVKRAIMEHRGAQPVVVLDVNMSFGSMVVFMIKWALAAIPAMLILMLIGFFAVMFLGGLAGTMR